MAKRSMGAKLSADPVALASWQRNNPETPPLVLAAMAAGAVKKFLEKARIPFELRPAVCQFVVDEVTDLLFDESLSWCERLPLWSGGDRGRVDDLEDN